MLEQEFLTDWKNVKWGIPQPMPEIPPNPFCTYLRNIMIYITQLIYIVDGQETVFDQFEAIAIPAISKYNGRLLFRVRPGEEAYIESTIEKPYEIHLVEFETDNDFSNFMHDEDRRRFLHLKDQSIKSVFLVKGTKL